MNRIILSLPGNESCASGLEASGIGRPMDLHIHRFPDGETMVRVDPSVSGCDILVVCTLHEPDPQVMSLILTSDLCRQLGATSVSLVAPYLAYMRQDKRFEEGQSISAGSFMTLLSSYFDAILAVDPHLHRIHSLDEVCSVPTKVVHAAGAIGEWIKEHVEDPIVIGPDGESRQWVADVAKHIGAPFEVVTKLRFGDRDVQEQKPDAAVLGGHQPVLVDDIISTGQTLAQAAKNLLAAGTKVPICIGVHAVFAGDAEKIIRSTGITQIVTCDTIPHPTNGIALTSEIAKGIHELLDITKD